MAKVFVSYRTIDAPAALKVASDIRRAGHEVWFDQWEIGIGDSIVERMNAGLSQADFVVLCYSSQGVEAPWVMREWTSALAAQLDGQGVRVLPAILTGGRPPALLADLKAANLHGDWSSGMKALLDAIK
jgi:hypothetical protein